ncbi:MAG: nucleotidyl transferase AbiEii/AbiGii toxin family protein [Desulfobacteraceae bacterium]|nr:nucleotidyl transferase AbiEii/AbiGii toxin family protein [Desulfobacteraceae bacterium]
MWCQRSFFDSTILALVQVLAKSKVGSQIAFEGGTALKLFYDLPRYSENIDYDSLRAVSPKELNSIIKGLCTKKRWEITDDAVKFPPGKRN